MNIVVRSHDLGEDLREFLDVVDLIYKGDPYYVRPLDFDVRERLSPKHPYFAHSKGIVFTAHQNGSCVGRLVAHRNEMHLARYQDGVGFFGFFDTINDAQVCAALVQNAASWHRAQGLKRLRGPVTLSMEEEVGCLIDGFDYPPMLLMGHHRPYQAVLLEEIGMKKAKDVYAWRYECGNMPPGVVRAHDTIANMPEVKF